MRELERQESPNGRCKRRAHEMLKKQHRERREKKRSVKKSLKEKGVKRKGSALGLNTYGRKKY